MQTVETNQVGNGEWTSLPPVDGWVTITPTIADTLLGTRGRQRKLIPRLVEHYARQMREGAWASSNPQPIIVGPDGALIDGQHRCAAVVASGIPIAAKVERVTDATVFEVIDTGRPRTARDLISIDVQGTDVDAGALTMAATLQWLHERKLSMVSNNARQRPTPSDISSTIRQHPGLLASVRVVAKFRVRGLLGLGAATWFHYQFSLRDPHLATRFFASLHGGESPRGTGARELRERLLVDQGAKRQISRLERYALIIKAWNAERAGVEVKNLKFTTTGIRAEQFPVIK